MKRIRVGESEVHICGIKHVSWCIASRKKVEKAMKEGLYDIVLLEGSNTIPFHKLKLEEIREVFKDFHIYEFVRNGEVKKIGIIDPAIDSFGIGSRVVATNRLKNFLRSLLFFVLNLTILRVGLYDILTQRKRDDFMSMAIKNLANHYKKILVVVGEAHEKAIYKRLKDDTKINLWKYYREYMEKLNKGEVNYGAIIYSIKEDKARFIPYYPFLREFEIERFFLRFYCYRVR